jgi:hypothetical protein
MIDYRAYIVGADGHFHSSKTILAEDDDHALKVAKQLVDGHDVELWQLDRKIAVLASKDS